MNKNSNKNTQPDEDTEQCNYTKTFTHNTHINYIKNNKNYF